MNSVTVIGVRSLFRAGLVDLLSAIGFAPIEEADNTGQLGSRFGEAPPPSILALTKEVPGSREWVAHCGSMSKVLSPGLRVGWMIAPPELLAKATMCKQFSDAHTSIIISRPPHNAMRVAVEESGVASRRGMPNCTSTTSPSVAAKDIWKLG